MIEKINIIISLVAAIIVTIVSIIQKIDITSLAFRLIFTIILFFILGTIAKVKLKKMFDDELYDGLEIYNADLNDVEADTEDSFDDAVEAQAQQNNISNI